MRSFGEAHTKNLNGMILIDVLRGMHRNGERISKENVVEALNSRGFDLSRTSNNVPVMKLWLNEAGVLRGWRIDEHKLSELTELSEGEYRLLRTLRPEQYYFLRALCNTASENYQRACRCPSIGNSNLWDNLCREQFLSIGDSPVDRKRAH